MLAYIYTRVSSEEQARDGVSLGMQESACRELVARLYPDAAVRTYCDDGYSAETLLRPALQEMLDALAEADVLVIWRQDRLLRHPRHLEGMMEMCATAGVRIVSTQGEVAWGNASERAFTRVRAVFSGLEVEQMSERISAALDHIAHEGRHPGGCLYGYRREGGALVVVDEQAAIVREVYERYAAGESLAGIALSLTDREVPRRRGGTNWGNTAVDRMLANPTYCGRVPWKGDVARDAAGAPVLGTHQPLVPVELWERVQALRRQRGRNHGRHARHLSPICRCGYCGGPVCAHQRSVPGVILDCCLRKRSPVDQRHPGIGIREDKLSAMLWRHTARLLTSGDLRDALAEHRAQATRAQHGAEAMRAELADLEARRRRNLQAYQAGAITLEDLAQQNAPLVARDAELRAQMAEGVGVPDGVEELGALRPGAARRLVASLRKEPVEAQLLFISRLYEAVEIHRGYVLVRYAGGVLEPVRLDSSWVWHGEDSVPW